MNVTFLFRRIGGGGPETELFTEPFKVFSVSYLYRISVMALCNYYFLYFSLFYLFLSVPHGTRLK